MLHKETHISGVSLFVLGAILLMSPCEMLAQHGGHGGGGTGGRGSGSRSGGASDKDDLKDFHRALALQATDAQIAKYQAVLKSADAAGTALQALAQPGKENKAGDFSRLDADLDQVLEELRNDNKEFLNSFSHPQKSGLKDLTKSLLKADSDLVKQTRVLDQRVGEGKGEPAQIAVFAESVNKTLTTFRTELTSLGKEMGIESKERASAPETAPN